MKGATKTKGARFIEFWKDRFFMKFPKKTWGKAIPQVFGYLFRSASASFKACSGGLGPIRKNLEDDIVFDRVDDGRIDSTNVGGVESVLHLQQHTEEIGVLAEISGELVGRLRRGIAPGVPADRVEAEDGPGRQGTFPWNPWQRTGNFLASSTFLL